MLRLTIFDVGQASSALLEFGENNLGIVDFGGSPFSKSARIVEHIRERLAQNEQARIAFIVITHLDLDHISGLEDLLSDKAICSKIGKIYCNQLEYQLFREVLRKKIKPGSGVTKNPWTVKRLGSLKALINTIKARSSGDRDFHGELISPSGNSPSDFPVEINVPLLEGNYRILLLSPSQFLRNKALFSLERELDHAESEHNPLEGDGRWTTDWNSASAVLSIEYAGRRLLLCGDATAKTFQEILTRSLNPTLPSDVTVAWHHGGRLGSVGKQAYDPMVWDAVLIRKSLKEAPLVLISHGCENLYGHPHPETIQHIRSRGGLVLCTELREPSLAAPFENPFPFDKVGCALTVGNTENNKVFRADSHTCCGDIVVEISPQGTVQWTTAEGANFRHQSSTCCCSLQAKVAQA